MLACGVSRKTVLSYENNLAILSQHRGDLKNYEALQFLEQTLERMQRLSNIAARGCARSSSGVSESRLRRSCLPRAYRCTALRRTYCELYGRARGSKGRCLVWPGTEPAMVSTAQSGVASSLLPNSMTLRGLHILDTFHSRGRRCRGARTMARSAQLSAGCI